MPAATKELPEFVALATTSEDLGILTAKAAVAHARDFADVNRTTVYLRDTVTDKVLRTIRPAR